MVSVVIFRKHVAYKVECWLICFALLFVTMTGVAEFDELKCQLDTHLCAVAFNNCKFKYLKFYSHTKALSERRAYSLMVYPHERRQLAVFCAAGQYRIKH